MILIDNRVGSRELHPHIPRNLHPTLTRLDFADIAFTGNGPGGEGSAFIGIERKRLKDFLSSMQSGRLANHQLVGMANAYHHSYVVIEGVWRDGRGGLIEIPIGRGKWVPLTLGSQKFTTASMDNFINSMQLQLKVMVILSPSLARTAAWLSNTYKWWTVKKWSQHRSCQGKVDRCQGMATGLVGKAPLVARVAMELTGVGVDRAQKIASRFSSIESLCAASVEDLMEVDGIGETTARGVWREIRGER